MRRDRVSYQQLMGDVPDSEVVIPGRKKPDPNAEWRLQAACVKLLRRAMRTDPHLRFIAAMPEGRRDPVRANIAKMCGLAPGVADLIIMRRFSYPQIGSVPSWSRLQIDWVELKRPDKPARLDPEQKAWADWLAPMATVRTHCINSLEAFRVILESR